MLAATRPGAIRLALGGEQKRTLCDRDDRLALDVVRRLLRGARRWRPPWLSR